MSVLLATMGGGSAAVELQSGFILTDAGPDAAAAAAEDPAEGPLSLPVPVGTTYCHGGPSTTCYCNPKAKPPNRCFYNGPHPSLPCPQCGTSNCSCPPAPPAPAPAPSPPPTPPAPAPPAPPGPPPGPAPSFPVGTISNGTCVPAPYHGTDCDTHASGYFSGLASLAACAAKVKPCKMGNYISYGADKSCSWYQECDFAHLCVDCSKDTGPNCPVSVGLPKCPHYIAFVSCAYSYSLALLPARVSLTESPVVFRAARC